MPQKSFGLVAVLLLLGLVAAEPKSPAVVTVFKTDGTSIRGTVVVTERDAVTVTPAGKPAEQVVLPWKQIKSISNGLTAARALAQWKESHAGKLCDTCTGDGVSMCPTCKGTRHDPAAGKDCPTCKGELLVACKAPRCKDGATPCPSPCVKLTEGTWVKRDDGKRWREIKMGGGTMSISESHVGELYVQEKPGTPPVSKGPCPTCAGKTTLACTTCRGQAKVACATCTNRKNAAACPDQCTAGQIPCPPCGGKGLKG